MKKTRIGINGFGRIGRLITRISIERNDVEVVAINDPFLTADYAKYLFEHDTIHGSFKGTVVATENSLIINGKEIMFVAEKELINLNWKKAKVDIVAEATGKFTSFKDAQQHITCGGAKKVVVTAPGKEMPMFVMGVNQDKYKSDMSVISNASCTTNCLAPLVKVIDDTFGIKEGLMSTIHSVTATQLTVDGSTKKDWRGGRAASYNIIPSTTGAAKAVGSVIPNLQGKLTGMSYRVPTLDVSVVDLTCTLKKDATIESITDAITKASQGEMKGIIGITDEMVVSSDFIGDYRTCIFDKNASIILSPKFVKLVAWYDNEWGYSAKTIDLISYINNH